MRHTYIFLIVIASSFGLYNTCSAVQPHTPQATNKESAHIMNTKKTEQTKQQVHKKQLKNGMTVLVKVARQIPKVCIQLWYHVGSKDEKTKEKGIAHLIEHMIFKGTKKLSESDINIITHKLSGVANAFTSYDYTGYWFNFPTQHWQEALPIMADCMQNVTFKEDHLNSEMKAVIQELKMGRDNYTRSLLMELMGSIFPDHPYHYPVIGFKQDLWTVHADDLRAFYKKHYGPNNATLVVVGDVVPEDVFAQAEKDFGAIQPIQDYEKEEFYFAKDIVAKSISLYRDVVQPMAMMLFVVPGIKHKTNQLLDVASLAVASGKASRLHKKLVDELQLATSITSDYWSLFDHSLFFIFYEPRSVKDITAIENIIREELEHVAERGFTTAEISRAVKKAKMSYFSMLESSQQQAQEIGLYYLATGDEQYVFDYLNQPIAEIQEQVQQLVQQYFRSAVAHTGYILPLPESEKPIWKELQEKSDQEDQKILSARERTSAVENPQYSLGIKAKDQGLFNYPKYQQMAQANGLKVLYYHNDTTPKIELILELKAKNYYDPVDKQGLYNFVAKMLTEGTKNYTAAQLADELESRGMSLNAYPGGISMSMLSSDFEKGLELLHEVLTNAVFNENDIEKIRIQILAEIAQFWDDPKSFAGQLIREQVYKGHPYSKNVLGTKASVQCINRKDLVDFYKKYFSPADAKIAIVGDIKNHDLQKVLQKNLAAWSGQPVQEVEFTALAATKDQEINFTINRDQVLLCFAGLSVERKHKDFDKFLLFDQILGGGVLGSMHSRLFALREQSGLFYTISGSLIARANEQPGMVLVQTLVSMDRLKEAEHAIKNTLDHVTEKIEDGEFLEARSAIVNSLVNNFETNFSMAQAFLFLDRYNFPIDYFDTRAQQLSKITKTEMQQAAKNLINTKNMITLRVGRVSK